MNGVVIWLTGRSGAGTSTIAQQLRKELAALGRSPDVFDGDEVNTDVQRIGYLARLIARQGGVATVVAIPPHRQVREELRDHTPGFVDVFVRGSYEPPHEPDVVVDTERETVEGSVAMILRELERRNYLHRAPADRMPAAEQREELLRLARKAPGVDISARDHADLSMLSTGAVAPLYSFMDQADYGAVVETGRLAEGAPFTLSILLRVEADVARAASSAEWLALRRQGQPIGLLKPTDTFRTDTEAEAAAVYATRSAPSWALAGEAVALTRPPSAFTAYDLTPSRVQAAVAERGWRTMVGFQTRNPVHRAHECLHHVARESADGLLLHPLVGETQDDDIPTDVRMHCYEALLANDGLADRLLLTTNPTWMRYAGPREAVFHAIVRQNFGCTHFVVGHDHAGVGGYYDAYAVHRIFDQYQPGELGIEILHCGSMTSAQIWTDEFDTWEIEFDRWKKDALYSVWYSSLVFKFGIQVWYSSLVFKGRTALRCFKWVTQREVT
jgi:sulfate adenylyltransferase